MSHLISWKKEPKNRYFQRKFVKYNFYDNENELGFFQMRGVLNLETQGKFSDQNIIFKYKSSPNSKWYSYKRDVSLYENNTNKRLAVIIDEKYTHAPFQILIKTADNNIYTFEINNHKISFWKSELIATLKKEEKNLIQCKYEKSEFGELTIENETPAVLVLATFHILHQFMELFESD
jgi:hypothetical protein